MNVHRLLLVANRTATSRVVHDAVLARAARAEYRVTLLVPATPPSGTWTWDEAAARLDARHRMVSAVTALRRDGIDITGAVGDFSPIDAIRDEIKRHAYDEILIFTLCPKISLWLKQDLPTRTARESGIPVTHVVVDDPHAAHDQPTLGEEAKALEPRPR